MASVSEDEFTLSLFLGGETIYNFTDKQPNSKLICINCNRVYPLQEDISKCPNCYLNTIIFYDKKSSLDKFKIVMLREYIIVSTLSYYDFQEDQED